MSEHVGNLAYDFIFNEIQITFECRQIASNFEEGTCMPIFELRV